MSDVCVDHDGVVTEIRDDDHRGWCVAIDDKGTRHEYLNLLSVDVQPGAAVKAGDVIGQAIATWVVKSSYPVRFDAISRPGISFTEEQREMIAKMVEASDEE